MQHPFIIDNINQPSFTTHQMIVNDYLLVLQPHEDLYNKIMQTKKMFAEKFDCPAALYSKPHITLLRFMQLEMLEKKIINKLQNCIETATPFLVTLKNF